MNGKITVGQVIFVLIIAISTGVLGWLQGKKQITEELGQVKQQSETKVVEQVLIVEVTRCNLSDYFPDEEIKIMIAAAKRNNLKEELYPILFAIRKAENGGKRRELGILHPKCEAEMDKRPNETFDIQAGWAAATVQKNYDRWVEVGKQGRYIDYLASVYCPINADNDLNGLNK